MAKRKIDLEKLKKAGQKAHLKHKTEEGGVENVLEIPLSDIKDNPYQPRVEVGENDLNELCESIREHGLLQPVLVTKAEEGFCLVAGHRRVEACKRLGKKSVKAILLNEAQSDEKLVSLSLIENVQRVNLDPLETAMACHRALRSGIYKNQSELAKSIGKSKIFVSKLMGVLKLDQEILEDLANHHRIGDLETLYLLSRVKDKKEQKKFYEKIVKGEMNREDLKRVIKEGRGTGSIDTFQVKFGKNRITIQNPKLDIPKEKISDFEKELKSLIEKYSISN